MGCCVSTPKSSEGTPLSPPKDQNLEDRSLVPESDTLDIKIKSQPPPPPPPVPRPTLPPPPPVEEETVKEVLSETPAPKPYLPNSRTDHHHQQQQQQQQQRILRPPSFSRTDENYKNKLSQFEEISQASEISNLSEASVSTSAYTEISRDDFQDRSPAKIRRKPSNSPVRRREPIVAKSLPSRREVDQNSRRRVVVRNSTTRTDPGECSGQRSRSPATIRTDMSGVSRNGVSRSMSARRNAASPVKGPDNRETRESLEDPLVSLECFIFL